ncbi:MAG: symmetrical bis(5'-nucleosyl)-tetraphosphatase [Burkholderiaceae bacterium]
MIHLVGDVQGCCDALARLLDRIGFSASRDHLYVLGDLVNRGPDSLGTLRILQGLGGSATCLLGNHDLHALAVAHGARKAQPNDTLASLLAAPDREALFDWLRGNGRMAVHEHGWLMVHAGVVPQWDLATTLSLASEVEQALRGPSMRELLDAMYGNQPARWRDDLTGWARLRFAINVLTRVRFVAADGTLDFATKDGRCDPPAGFYRWFEAPARRTEGLPIAFGHWSTLGLVERPDLLSTDTGCVWGGRLTAVRIDGGRREVSQVECPQAQRPG